MALVAATTTAAAAQSSVSNAGAEAEPAIVAGRAGATLTSRAATGAVTLSVDPELRDGRLSIRMVAANFGAVPVAFGPGSVKVVARGRMVRIATPEDLVGRVIGRSQRDSALACASAAPTIAGFGQRDVTQDDTPTDAVSGVAGDRFARGDRIDGGYEARDREIVRLRAALLGDVQVPPRGNRAGAVLTSRVPRGTKAVEVDVTFVGTIHRFAVELAR